jgi:predicted rRNA methylase YqxC with S4 and FtsJ domains
MKTLDWSVETLDRECNYKKTQKNKVASENISEFSYDCIYRQVSFVRVYKQLC